MGYTHGTAWTDEIIEEKIMECVNGLKLDHFPTHNEMVEYFGNKGLASKVGKYKGTGYWAEKLGLPLKLSETVFGNSYEEFAVSDIFENTGLTSVMTSSRHPYDIFVNNAVKIDVKASREFVTNSNSKAFTFNLEKREPTCDIYLLYCINDDKTIRKKLIIPACALLGQTQVGVGNNSKWDFFKDRWDVITEFNTFFDQFKNPFVMRC